MKDVWSQIQYCSSGVLGVLVLLFYFAAIIQLCRAKFFFLEPTDTFLFYYCFVLGLITTTSHFIKLNVLWNMEHSLELLLQVIFCFIFALIIDPQKRIFLFLHLFYLAATFVILIFVVQTILVALLSSDGIANDWRCTGYLGIIVPGASFLFSGILTIFAMIATKAAKQNKKEKSYSNSSNLNSSQSSRLNLQSDQSTPRFIVEQTKRKVSGRVPQVQRQSVKFIRGKSDTLRLNRVKPDKMDTKERIAQIIRDYYSSSKRELLRKQAQVMALIFINTASIVVQFSLILFLIMTGTNNFEQVTDYAECQSRFHFQIGWIIVLNIIRAVVDYSPILLVFYFTFWRYRGAVRSDDESSIDIMLSSSSDNGRLYQSLLPERDENQNELYDSSGEDLVDWVTRRENQQFSGESGQRVKIRNITRQHLSTHHHAHHQNPHQEQMKSAEESGAEHSESNYLDTSNLLNRISSDYSDSENELSRNDTPISREKSAGDPWS